VRGLGLYWEEAAIPSIPAAKQMSNVVMTRTEDMRGGGEDPNGRALIVRERDARRLS